MDVQQSEILLDPSGYVSYLPHSGFNNQRIELLNAFVIAKLLNRTLILPPLYPSHDSVPWLYFEKLKSELRTRENDSYPVLNWNQFYNTELLRNIVGIRTVTIRQFLLLSTNFSKELALMAAPMRAKAVTKVLQIQDQHRYDYCVVDKVPLAMHNHLWDNNNSALLENLVDGDKTGVKTFSAEISFTAGVAEQRILDIRTFVEYQNNISASVSRYNVSTMETSLTSVKKTQLSGFTGLRTSLNDSMLTYTFSIFKSGHLLNLDALSSRPNFLIQLGSLFGRHRIRLLTPEANTLRDAISALMIPEVPFLTAIVNDMHAHILTNFGPLLVGLHVRVGDGPFQVASLDTLRYHSSRLWNLLDFIQRKIILSSPRKFSIYIATDAQSSRLEKYLHIPVQRANKRARKMSGRGKTYPKFQLVFPGDVISFARRLDGMEMDRGVGITEYFKALDYWTSIGQLSTKTLQKSGIPLFSKPRLPISKIGNLRSCFASFLDLLLVSRSVAFIGTQGSTFSGYVTELMVSWWNGSIMTGKEYRELQVLGLEENGFGLLRTWKPE